MMLLPHEEEFLGSRRASTTGKIYARSLRRFREFLLAQGWQADLDRCVPRITSDGMVVGYRALGEAEICEFALTLARTFSSRPQIATRILAEVRVYLAWLEQAGYAFRNPAEHVRLPRHRVHRNVYPFTEEEFRRLWEAAGKTSRPLRDRAILVLVGYMALRPREVCSMKTFHVDASQGDVLVSVVDGTKQNHQGVTPLSELGTAVMRGYLRVRTGWNPEQHILILDNAGKPFHPDSLRSHLRLLMRAAGVDTRHTTYDFRRFAASRLAAQGVPLTTISQLMRHKRLTTTLGYIHPLEPLDMRGVMEDTLGQLITKYELRAARHHSDL